MNDKCPICELGGNSVSIGAEDYDVIKVRCDRCGSFIFSARPPENWDIPPVPRFILDKGIKRSDHKGGEKLLRTYLSIYSRGRSEKGQPARFPIPFDITKMGDLAQTYSETPIAAKPEKLLRLLANRTLDPGLKVIVNAELDYPAIHAVSPREFDYHLQFLANEQCISEPFALRTKTSGLVGVENFVRETAITHKGWSRIGQTGNSSRTAFVAMSFHNSLDDAYLDGIAPGINDVGYEAVRVDKTQHNEKICDRIIVEIRRSRFVVADVTLQRPGVYFEAGFAMALGLPVIWCCREDDQSNIHFDTRQYNHIFWKEPSDLRGQLHTRISATIVSAR